MLDRERIEERDKMSGRYLPGDAAVADYERGLPLESLMMGRVCQLPGVERKRVVGIHTQVLPFEPGGNVRLQVD